MELNQLITGSPIPIFDRNQTSNVSINGLTKKDHSIYSISVDIYKTISEEGQAMHVLTQGKLDSDYVMFNDKKVKVSDIKSYVNTLMDLTSSTGVDATTMELNESISGATFMLLSPSDVLEMSRTRPNVTELVKKITPQISEFNTLSSEAYSKIPKVDPLTGKKEASSMALSLNKKTLLIIGAVALIGYLIVKKK
jgi:hypothetical protein